MPASKTLKQKLQELRHKKGFRVGVIVVLIIILLALYFIGGKFKTLILVLLVVAFSALGMQLTDYDLDLATLWETGSIQESRVESKNGVKLVGKCLSDNINCSNFDTQEEAQALYNDCAAQIEANNTTVEDAKSIDVYGLDRDKDGLVCESLPKAIAR